VEALIVLVFNFDIILDGGKELVLCHCNKVICGVIFAFGLFNHLCPHKLKIFTEGKTELI
jgi:hypothetical protein